MRKGKKDKLLLNLLEGERYKHKVAMVTEEAAFNQHEPNSNMARMFVVMLMIHVVVIGGIIIYDYMNGESAPENTVLREDYGRAAEPVPASPAAPVQPQAQDLEEHATYTWKSGDSFPVVAQRLKVPEETLIKLNQGREIKTNAIILYPKAPVKKALAVGVAGANGEMARPSLEQASIAAAEVPMNLAIPGEADLTFSATIEDQLTPVPNVAPGMVVVETPPAAEAPEAAPDTRVNTVRVELPPAAPAMQEAPPAPVAVPEPVLEKKPAPAPAPVVAEKPVPKAIPVPMPAAERKSEPVVKKIQETPPAPKKEPAKAAPVAAAATHTIQAGDTMYRIASKHGISVAALQAANKNARPESLRIGMKLVIPRK